MAEGEKKKDVWDKLSSVTPLLLGLAVTGVGALFTQIYNFQQLQLNQITALDKLRPLLTSDKPEERAFGYASFAALGYEDIAIRMIQLKQDESGRPVLVELQKGGAPQVQANATGALKTLDEARSLVNKLEYGSTEGIDAWMEKGTKLADEIGLQTKLGRALMAAQVIQMGLGKTRKLADATKNTMGGNPSDGVDEKAWVNEYLNQMLQSAGPMQRFIEPRVREFRGLIEKGDWDLRAYRVQPPADAVETNAAARSTP